LQQFGAAVEANLAAFDSGRLLDVLKVLRHLQQQLHQQPPLVQHQSLFRHETMFLDSSVPLDQSHASRRSVISSRLATVSQSLSMKQMHSRMGSMPAPLKDEAKVVSEAYSMACLVVLMPSWLQDRIADWPRQLAADKKASSVRSSSMSLSS
jgi:hypothetical protein